MEELEKVIEEQPQDMTQDYLDQITKLKKSTVSKQEYDKMLEENRRLLNTIVNGETAAAETKDEPMVDVNALRKDLFNGEGGDMTNLEFISKVLDLREALIKSGENDPFLPYGKDIIPTDEDIAAANRVATALAECVEYADGNSDIFTNELQRITVDSAPIRRK